MTLTIAEGDLLDQPVEVIVNPWNRNFIPWWLLWPQGVSGAIKRRAGYEPFRELAREGMLPWGGAVLTGAGRLPYRGIIHVAGIGLLWLSSAESIRKSVRNALEIAAANGFRSIAFPLIGAGTGGRQPDKVQAIMEDEIRRCEFDGAIVIVRYKKRSNQCTTENRPYLFLGLGLLALLASCAAPPAAQAVAPQAASRGPDPLGHRPGPQGFTTVVIDAGHGGKDSGATSRTTGQQEKNLTLDTAKRIHAELGSGFNVILMRSDDTFVELDDRVARANRHGDAILVSMHFNSGPQSLRGPETYYWRVDSHGLAVRLQRAMAQACPGQNANRGLVRRRLRLTRNPQIPCVLMEGGYLSNPAEARLIATPAYRQHLAAAIAAAIRTQAAIGDAGTGPLPPPRTAPPSRASDKRE